MKYLFAILFMLLGARDVSIAIETFHDGRYYLCGLGVMLTIFMAISMFRVLTEI